MLGPNRRRQESILAYRIPLWGAFLIVVALLYLDNSPLVLEASHPESTGEQLTRDRPSDVVCVLSYEAITENRTANFQRRDWSAAWIDLLEQHLGPISIVTPESLSSDHLDRARVVVLTASVSDRVPESLADRLREYALDGDLLVVERPEGHLRDIFSANGKAGRKTGRSVTFAQGISDPYKSQLTEMPLSTHYVGSTSPRDGAESLFAVDGAPAIYATEIGEGTVVTIDFDLGEQLVALQQGRPDDEFRVQSSNPERSSRLPPRTDALVADEALRGAETPYADLLERFIVHGVLQRYAAVPGFWPFPGGAAGVVVPLHPDRRLGDAGGWMLEYETERQATSTLLTSVDAGLTAAGAAVIDRRGGDIGLLWRRAGTPAERTEPWGVWGLEPVANPLELGDQLEDLQTTTTDQPTIAARSAGRWWDRRWARPLRELAHEGVALDLSYAPREKGYAFGTGFPFRLLDRTGLPLPLRELPTVVPVHRTAEFSLHSLLEASRAGHHQVLTYALPPTSFGDFPNMNRFENWVESFDHIRQTDHVLRNTRQLIGFWRGRLRSTLRSEIIQDATMPEPDDLESANSDDDEEDEARTNKQEQALLLRLTADVERNDISISVPETVDGRSFDHARRRASRVGGELVARKLESEPESVVGYELRRIPVEAGSTRIDVYYR